MQYCYKHILMWFQTYCMETSMVKMYLDELVKMIANENFYG